MQTTNLNGFEVWNLEEVFFELFRDSVQFIFRQCQVRHGYRLFEQF